jgi:hypothetical protein
MAAFFVVGFFAVSNLLGLGMWNLSRKKITKHAQFLFDILLGQIQHVGGK